MALSAPTSMAETSKSTEIQEKQKSTETEYYKGEAFLAAKQGCKNAAEEYISQALKAARKENKTIAPQEIEAILNGESSYVSDEVPGESPVEFLQHGQSSFNKTVALRQEFEKQVQGIVSEIQAKIEMLKLFAKTLAQEPIPVAA